MLEHVQHAFGRLAERDRRSDDRVVADLVNLDGAHAPPMSPNC
jgi:hypothetical protein